MKKYYNIIGKSKDGYDLFELSCPHARVDRKYYGTVWGYQDKDGVMPLLKRGETQTIAGFWDYGECKKIEDMGFEPMKGKQ